MQEKSKKIFGNPMTGRVYRKAVKSRRKYMKKFGDDTGVSYPVSLQKNNHIGDSLGVVDVLFPEGGRKAIGGEEFDKEKGIVVRKK